MSHTLFLIGGILNLLLAGFHLTFWKTFDWPKGLRSLTPLNRAVMQVLNIHTFIAILMFGIAGVWFAGDLLTTGFGRFFAGGVAVFYLVRVVNQIVFFDPRKPVSIGFIVLFAVMMLCYALPLMA